MVAKTLERLASCKHTSEAQHLIDDLREELEGGVFLPASSVRRIPTGGPNKICDKLNLQITVENRLIITLVPKV